MEREGGVVLPLELWDIIFTHTSTDHQYYFREKKKQEERGDVVPPFVPGADLWKQLANFMLVNKAWYNNVWACPSLITAVSCGFSDYGGVMPTRLALDLFLPKVGNRIHSIDFMFARSIANEEDEEEEEREKNEEEKKNARQKEKEAVMEECRSFLKAVKTMCPNLVSLSLPTAAAEVVGELFDDENSVPSNWSRTMRILNLNCLSDDHLRVICKGKNPLTSLESINIRSSKCLTSNSVATSLPCIPGLVRLDIDGINLSDEDAEALYASLPSLKFLSNGWTQALSREAQVEAIAKCTALKELCLPYAGYKSTTDGAMLQSLTVLTNLTELDLMGNYLKTKELAILSQMPWLRDLNVEHAEFSEEGISEHFTRLVNLRKASFVFVRGVCDSSLPSLARLTSLTSLNIKFCGEITDTGVATLSSLTNLRKLALSIQDFSGTGLVALKPLSQLVKLVIKTTNEGMESIVATFPQLRHLEVGYCGITDQAIEPLTALTALVSLSLCGCEKLTINCVPGLTRLTTLKVLQLPSPSTAVGVTKELFNNLTELGCKIYQWD